MTAAVISASAGLLVVVLAFALNQRGQIRQERRQARLTRINSQLRELYGPLNALVDANERVFKAMQETRLPPVPRDEQDATKAEWLLWRNHALMPTNRRMRDLIIEHADLLLETDVPLPLREFCAHVASLEVVQAAEAQGLHEPTLIDHPGEAYVNYVKDTFQHLKLEQKRLLAAD